MFFFYLYFLNAFLPYFISFINSCVFHIFSLSISIRILSLLKFFAQIHVIISSRLEKRLYLYLSKFSRLFHGACIIALSLSLSSFAYLTLNTDQMKKRHFKKTELLKNRKSGMLLFDHLFVLWIKRLMGYKMLF